MATSTKVHDSEVPHAATMQPPKCQPTCQTGGRMTDGRSTATEDHHTAMVQPQIPQTTSRRVREETADVENLYAMCAKPTLPVDRSQNPETASQYVHEETTGVANSNASHAKLTRTAGTSHDPPDEPLEEQAWDWVNEIDEVAEMAGGEGERAVEARGQGAGAMDATRKSPTVLYSESDSGDMEINHMCATPEETCNDHGKVVKTIDEEKRASDAPHEPNEAASKARPPPPPFSKPVSESLEGEQEGQTVIETTDKEELQGIIDNPDDTVNDPSERIGHLLACMHSTDAQKVDTAPGQIVELGNTMGMRME
ncbi:hypothetical protein JVT61DRAFT_7860 [Boletus reticuloceps]|uniref:Uncharacterized protein n=1 Tax=Boletus reticuloceps TaxID=495285 RepID=A0A8I2YIC0_9AGAM|nr:hypothetical protein JVT61DRAFT_7860 [Boletus reticuloceps]